MITNKELKDKALNSLSNKWGLAIGTFLVYGLIISATQFIPAVGWIIMLLIGGPMAVGIAIFSLSLSRIQEAKLEQIFEGFQNFGTSLVAYLLVSIFVFLWTLLLIIPGIIAAIAYSQVFYILAEDNAISPMDALRKSKKMMNGYKWDYFCLGLSFIGWFLLAILTLGIGFLWLMPYMQITFANFYQELKTKNNEELTPQLEQV